MNTYGDDELTWVAAIPRVEQRGKCPDELHRRAFDQSLRGTWCVRLLQGVHTSFRSRRGPSSL